MGCELVAAGENRARLPGCRAVAPPGLAARLVVLLALVAMAVCCARSAC
jgi:hypothetical protein